MSIPFHIIKSIHMNKYIYSLILLFSTSFVFSQEKEYTIEEEEPKKDSLVFVKVGTQIPYQFNVDLAYNFSKRVSAELEIGVIPTSFGKIITANMGELGMNADRLTLIEGFFTTGQVLGLGINYRFNDHAYVKLMGQMVDMTPQGIDMNLFNTIYDVSFAEYEQMNDANELVPLQLMIKSRLYNMSIFYGRKLFDITERLSLYSELGLVKPIKVNNYFWPQNYRLSEVQPFLEKIESANKDLQDQFLKYTFIPTVNIYLYYRLKTCNC